jgi:hypothetical protein
MPHYFTDCLPPKELLSQYPNWRIGGLVETRPGCHEGTIWNCGPYKSIDYETNLTAGDVYYADGTSSLALIGITDNETIAWATELRIYSADGFLQLNQEGYDPLTGAQGNWVSAIFPVNQHMDVTNDKLFPLKYCTHLRSGVTRRTISGGIELGGKHFDWDAWRLFSPPKKRKKKQ